MIQASWIQDIAAVTYNGTGQTPTVTVKDGTTTLVENTDYTVSYSNNVNAALSTATTNAPTVTITAVATSDKYAGTATKTFTISPKAVTVTAKSEAFTYDGTAHSNAGYDVEGLVGSDAISAVVEGSITFPRESPVTNTLKSYSFTTGTAGNYSVTTVNGQLTMTNANQAITITAASQSWTYDGIAHTNTTVTLTSGALFTGDELVAEATGSVTDVADTQAGNNPVKAVYKVMHGTEDVTANYVITAVAGTLTVNKKALESSMIADIADLTYNGAAETPSPVVTFNGMTLVENTDYTVAYSNNINAGTATVTITAVEGSNYSGSASKAFKIKATKGSVLFYPWKVKKKFGDEDFIYTPYVTGNGTLKYTSGNDAIATVNASTGEVSIKGVGEVRITASMTSSSNYTSASDYYDLTVEPKDIEYEDGTVTQDENGYTVNLTEDADHPNAKPLPSGADLAGLTYSRTLTAPGSGEGDVTIDGQPANLYTICVPFDPETGTAVKYYTLSGVSGETLNFSEVDTPVANTPYVIAVTGSVNFTEECTDLDVASNVINSTTKDGYTFTGTFTGLTNTQATGKYILQKGNKWGKVTKEKPDAYIPPFRAYVEGAANGARQLAGSIDGETTGIQSIRTTDADGTERWYDLQGRPIERPATKGIYIHNGRKETVK